MNFLRQLIDFVTYPFRLVMSAPLAVISAPRRLMGMSLPARVAVLVAIFLVICTITAYVAFFFSHKRADYILWLHPVRILSILGLLIAIPLIVYMGLKLWLEGNISRYPDIDYAWKAGMAALQQQGLDLLQTPVFLVLGTRDDVQAKSLMDASRLSLRVRDTPQGPAALHWYADPAGVYLVCTETSRLSRLASLAKEMDRFGGAVATPAAAQRGAPLRGTIMPGNPEGVQDSRPFSAPSDGAASDWSAANLRGTMVAGASGDEGPRAAAAGGAVTLSTAEATEQTARLEYVCKLLRRARQPLCPLNGILTLLPFSLIQRSPREAIEVQRAAQEDLATVRRMTKLRCPVTALVVGMEAENGFRELIRRVGADRAKVQRFGKGFNVWNPPIGEQIEAVARHACGAFEDWVYALFRESDGFNQVGNTKLYAMLCRIRSDLHARLTNLLVAAYSHDSQSDPADKEPLLFSGCYFAATGETDDRQAFVKSVFEKLIEQENELDWTEEALAENERYQRLARLSLGFSGLLAVCLIGMVAYKFMR